MIKIEFPADRPDIAHHLGLALIAVAEGSPMGAGHARRIAAEACAPSATVTPEVVPAMSDEEVSQLAAACRDGCDDHEEHASPKGSSLFDAQDGTAAAAGTDTSESFSPGHAAARLDPKGVAFHSAFCGEAKEPFYASGKNKDQWKKKKGVDQPVYDAWYAEQLGALDAAFDDDTVPGPEINAAAAFGNTATPEINAAAAFGNTAAQQAPAADAPTDAPSLMLWISERQAAGELTQDDVNAAYTTTNLGMQDIFGDNPTPAVAALHTFLLARVS